jgi:hypothetical protein
LQKLINFECLRENQTGKNQAAATYVAESTGEKSCLRAFDFFD